MCLFRFVLNQRSMDVAIAYIYSLGHIHRFTISELLKSEKEYVARLNFAMLHYLPLIFESMAPRALRAQKETLLGNLNDIWEFHSK